MGFLETVAAGVAAVMVVGAARWAWRRVRKSVVIDAWTEPGRPGGPKVLIADVVVAQGPVTVTGVEMVRDGAATSHPVLPRDVHSHPQPPTPPFKLGGELATGDRRTLDVDLASTRAWLRKDGVTRPTPVVLRLVEGGSGRQHAAKQPVLIDPEG